MQCQNRISVRLITMVVLTLALAAAALNRAARAPDYFYYDPAETIVEEQRLQGSELYDPGLAVTPDGVWLTWLEFRPGEGDFLWLGLRRNKAWPFKSRITQEAARLARPTLTRDASGTLWLTHERFDAASHQWHVFAQSIDAQNQPGPAVQVSPGGGNHINHQVAAAGAGGIWVVWQGEQEGQFDVFIRRIGPAGDAERLSSPRHGDWHPAIAVDASGTLTVAWDSFTGNSFDVLARRRVRGEWQPAVAVADGPAFQGRAQLAADGRGNTWIVWEEGATNWGRHYTGNEKIWNNITDAYGPVHRFRLLRLGCFRPDGAFGLQDDTLPMPSFARAAHREHKRPAADRLGTFYERGKLAVDARDRLWLAYRHFYQPQVGTKEAVKHHVEAGWRVDLRRMDSAGWSSLYACPSHQRDGLQRLSMAAQGDSLVLAWTGGRTDRRDDLQPRGITVAAVRAERGGPAATDLQPVTLSRYQPAAIPAASPAPFDDGRAQYALYFGDLHRHTDLSLCFPFFDGSLDDAYRYGIEAGALDFLAVTDHSRDVDKGNVRSQIWWRSTKEVTRHNLGNRFVAYFAYERSNRDTDHNVISLRDDMLRPHQPDLPEFWAEIDRDTFTIPHRTSPTPAKPLCGKIWAWHDDAKRPLLEIYQGFRDLDVQFDAHEGLDLGYHFGFIGSSDHLATDAGYAAVWSAVPGREGIFRAMQARRTFGATAKIRLVFRCGTHWMGERFAAAAVVPPFTVEIDGTAPIRTLRLLQDGKIIRTKQYETASSSVRDTFEIGRLPAGEHYFYVHLQQVDGHQAWSSPIWLDLSPAK